ncbi:hypothetical protein JZX89_16160 [Agrobacterium sp. Rnr]|uniref:Uncharacterized protein n=1 Tax=Agrobacterium burrii TaxID=2815339 RepID=A0ABS3EJW7_9HYPH|nr:hypothetical protein [Agrobacterium burrii]
MKINRSRKADQLQITMIDVNWIDVFHDARDHGIRLQEEVDTFEAHEALVATINRLP